MRKTDRERSKSGQMLTLVRRPSIIHPPVNPMKTTDASFVQQVKDALSHLHDHAYLQLHPLASALASALPAEAKNSLHDRLCAEIEALRPPERLPSTDAAWRPYLSLHLRYVEGRDIGEVTAALALSPRQCRREHQKGLHALAVRLQQQVHALQSGASRTVSQHHDSAQYDAMPTETLEMEIERLGAAADDVAATAVGAVLPGVLDTLADFAAQHSVCIRANLAPDLPPVHVERVILRQVLLNTLAHLLERHSDGTVTISAKRCTGAVTVQMACDSTEAAPAKEGDERLAVVAQLLQMRRGMLTQEWDPCESIMLRLPSQQPSTVLVVDDNPDAIRLFRRFLSGTSFELLGATSSDEALRLAQDANPQAIVLDVMMPDRDGWEILQFLQHQPATRGIPVIICSVLQEQMLAQSLGAAHFLAKPVTRQALLSTLSTVIVEHPAAEVAAARPDLP